MNASNDGQLADIVFKRAGEGMAITDAKGLVLAVNEAFERLTGYSQSEVLGRSLNLLKSGRHSQEFYAQLWQSVREGGNWQGEIWNRHKNGEVYPEWLSISSVRDEDDAITHYVGVFTDIGRLIEAQAQIRYLAHHDPVTGLPNRALFDDRFDQAVRRALRDVRQMALLFVDINPGRDRGDLVGHIGANALMSELARSMQAAVRETDTLARIGASEFLLLIEEIDGPRSASMTADKLLKTFAAPIRVGDDQIAVSGNIGISFFPMDGQSLTDLITNADTAMHEARAQNRNTYRFYSSAMSAYAGERAMLERALRQSIEQKELSLSYQPQFDAATNDVIGVEALVRWTNPILGKIGPDRFIPVAEDNGLIHPIGEWVLREACRQFVEWQSQGIAPPTLSVNISAKQIELDGFVDMVAAILSESGLDGRHLELEITEAVLTDVAYVVPTIERLKQLGIQILIDDFGTGFSLISYLRTLPIRKLEIDRSFVVDIGHDADNEAIIRAIIGLAHTLGLRVIAEGVETEDQAAFLRREGCNDFQGYLLGRAVSAADFPKYFGPRTKTSEAN